MNHTLNALALAALAAAGCTSMQPHVHGNPQPATKAHWTIAVPSSLRALPEVDALIRARGERFTVQVVEFDAAAGTAQSRLESLRASLAALPHGTAMDEHLLVVGSPSTIAMGPWNFEGVKTPIATDWLLTNEAAVDGRSVARSQWQLALAGMPVGAKPEFNVTIPSEGRRTAGIAEVDDSTYIHISPFTTQDQKELPETELVSLIATLQSNAPGQRVVVSCAPNERERSKLARILAPLAQRPWRVFDGSLKTMDLVSVIAGARVHLGGDSGALHLAVMAGVPTVSWFRRYDGMFDWMPKYNASHRVLIGTCSGSLGMQDIPATDLVVAVSEVATPQ